MGNKHINQQLVQGQQLQQMQMQQQMQREQMQAEMHMQVTHELRQVGIQLYLQRMKRIIDVGDFDDLTYEECEKIGKWAEQRAGFYHSAAGLVNIKRWDKSPEEKPPEENPAEAAESRIITE